MLRTYGQVLTRPGAWRFSLAGVVARLPISTVGIGTVLAISSTYDSYALAGQVSGVLVLVQAACAPLLSRQVDRRGQAAVMAPAVVVAVLGLGALAATTASQGPAWLLFLCAAVVGATMGSMGALVRARWSHILRTPADLHTAYSWESLLDEVIFMIGPVAAAMLATQVTPTGGILFGAFAAVLGAALLLSQRSTEPPPHPRTGAAHERGGVLSAPMLVLVATFVGMGAVFGAIDVSVVAFTEEAGDSGLAGPVLAAFAAGSGLAGLLFGARHWTAPAWRRYVLGMVGLGVGVGALGLVGTVGALAVVGFVIGLTIAPTIITGNGIVTDLMPRGRLTEGLTWIGTALGIGVSVGSAVGGALIDVRGAAGGFTTVMVAGGVTVAITFAALPALRRATTPVLGPTAP